MASAVRVTRTARSAAVMPTGQFGARVAAIVAAQYQDCAVVPDGAVDEAFSAPARVVVAAMWRPSPALCERADVLSFSAVRPWLPVTLDHLAIHIGPVVVPPAAAVLSLLRLVPCAAMTATMPGPPRCMRRSTGTARAGRPTTCCTTPGWPGASR